MFCCGLLEDSETVEDAGISAGDVVLCLRTQGQSCGVSIGSFPGLVESWPIIQYQVCLRAHGIIKYLDFSMN